MRYIDSSVDQPDQSVAFWMQDALSEGVGGFHCQAGYFTLEGASLLVPALRQCATDGANIRLLLGANHGATMASHVSYLVGLLDLPRTHVALGVVNFDNALFHPKVYHVTRTDGSQTAYVGSANLTGPGIVGRNVEAGLVLDTRMGDDGEVLRQIVHHIDRWFVQDLPGLTKIGSVGDVDTLLASSVLAVSKTPAPREPGEEPSSDTASHNGATRRGLFLLPSLPVDIDVTPRASPALQPSAVAPTEDTLRRRFLRATEASFHFPQGVHLGHLLIILCLFSGVRNGTAFDDEFIRLNGSLGEGRLSGYRRQVKYKLLAAIELGLLNDIRLLSESEVYVPRLTQSGSTLWGQLAPILDPAALVLDADLLSTTTPEPASYYNRCMRDAQVSDPEVRRLWRSIVLKMESVRLMVRFLYRPGTPRSILKAEIYQHFFDFPPVIAFCDAMGIEPQTVTSAQHRLPFLLNLLDSCGVIEQQVTSVELSPALDHNLQHAIEEILI